MEYRSFITGAKRRCLQPVRRRRELIFAVARALRAIVDGRRSYFLPLPELVTRWRVARKEEPLDVLVRIITRAELFLLDELGYLPLESEDTALSLPDLL